MSQDQVCHILLGLALVKKFINKDLLEMNSGKEIKINLGEYALVMAKRILSHIKSDGPEWERNWIVRTPDNKPVKRGHYARFYQTGISKSGKKWFEWSDGDVGFLWNILYTLQRFITTRTTNDHMVATLSALGDLWGGKSE